MFAVSSRILWPVAILTLAVLIYSPGINGPFIFDDAPNIMENKAVHVDNFSFSALYDAVFSMPSGPLYRPVSMLTFALNYYAGGDDVEVYKLTNIVIHCLSILAVFYLALNLLRLGTMIGGSGANNHPSVKHQFWIALLAAALWGLHPLNLTSVLYVVQRMASLSGLFTFLSIALYLQGRITLLSDRHTESPEKKTRKTLTTIAWWVGAFIVALLGVFSKENALLIPFFLIMLEVVLLRWQSTEQIGWQRFFQTIKMLSYIGLAGLGIALIVFWNDLANDYRLRTFTMAERLYTEPRILWHYLSWSFIPDIRAMGLFHDDIPLSTDLLTPNTTLLAIVGLVIVLVVAGLLSSRYPLIAVAIYWFFIAHIIESTVFPLEIVHEHRNYVALLGPVLLVALMLNNFSRQLNFRMRMNVVVGLAIVLALASQTYARALSWQSYQELIEVELENHPDSTIVLYEYGRLWYLYVSRSEGEKQEQFYRKARNAFEQVYQKDEADLTALPALIRLHFLVKKTVEEKWLVELEHRLATKAIGGARLRHLFELVECRMNGNCPLAFDDVQGLLSATLTNPYGMRTNFHAAVINAQGALSWTEGKYAEAAEFFRQAYEVEPNPAFATSAINAYLESGNTNEAKRFAVDSVGLSSVQLQELGLE